MSTARVPTAVPAAAPLSQRLREGTRGVHDVIEQGASFNRLIVVRIPDDAAAPKERARVEYREIYRRFLIASYGFELAVRTRLETSPAFPIALASGYASEVDDPVARIEDDLAGLGVREPAPFGIMTGLPEAPTLAEWAGIDYVRRGSRAGGAVIAAAVAHNLGLTRESGAGFLGMYGKDTRRALTAMRAWIDSLPLEGADAARAVAAAVATFEATGKWHRRLEGSFR
jgi:heme oxygenase